MIRHVVEELAEDVLAELGAVLERAAHVGDRDDLRSRASPGFRERLECEVLPAQERFGPLQTDDVWTDTAVREARLLDRLPVHAHPDGGGEGGDVQVLALRDLVQLEQLARRWQRDKYT